MAKPLDSYIYCSPFLSVRSLDELLDLPAEDGRRFDIPDYSPQPDAELDLQRSCDAVNKAVDRLPPRQQAVIRAIYFAGHTVVQTARLLRVSAAAVVKLRTKALKHLMTILTPTREMLFS